MTEITTDEAVLSLLKGFRLAGVKIPENEFNKYNACSERVLKENGYLLNGTSTDSHDDLAEFWFIPEKYQSMDIEVYLFDKCSSDDERSRVEYELKLFKEKNLYMILKLMVYIVDTMREHNVLWGVGRGSSVASYVLYLIGVHRINSIKYDLDIHEFLK
jgi:DNA polymerase III alpha subunit